MTTCRTFCEVENWARQGCDAELPLALWTHAAECSECQKLVSGVQLIRRTVAEAPIYQLPPSRIDSIEAVLRAEVRTVPVAMVASSGRRIGRWVAIIGTSVLFGAAGMAAVVVNSRATKPSVQATAVASAEVLVSRIGAARGHHLGNSFTDPYRLDDGVVEFVVQRTAGAPPYRVTAGSYTIEATQARFRVEVTDFEVTRIEVAAGDAKAKRDGGAWVSIAAGQSYQPTALTKVKERAPVASVRPPEPERHRETAALPSGAVPSDQGFASAYGLHQSGQSFAAAKAFDALLVGGRLDATRRCDALYWSAQAYARGVNAALAESRARSLLDSCPNGLRRGDAALLLGEYAEGRGDRVSARRYYRVAMDAAQPATRLRAHDAFDRLGGN